MSHRLDRSVRRVDRGRILLGGSPGRMLRLSPAGARVLDRLERGERIDRSPAVEALLTRLVHAGVLHPEPPPGSGPPESEVTVVVPVRDRPDGLARLLDSLRTACPRVSVLVVDDGSAPPVHLDPDRHPEVRVVRRAHAGGPAAARNRGAAVAGTPLLAFVDSDCTVTPGWLGPLLAQLADPEVVAVAPRVAAAPATGGSPATVLERYETLRSPLDLGSEPGRVHPGTRISYVPSAALVVRRDAFESLGGFDERLRVGEDVDLVWRLVGNGGEVRYDPRSVVHHEVRAGAGEWWRQRVQYGSSAAELDRRHPGAVAPCVVSPWSLLVCALAGSGRWRTAAAVVAGTTVSMRRRLPGVPPEQVARLVVGGHAGAARQLARAAVRVWWPVTVPLAVVHRRSRRWALAAVVATFADAVRTHADPAAPAPSPPLDALRRGVLALLDDLAYGTGVWLGCLRARSLRALAPRLSGRRDRA